MEFPTQNRLIFTYGKDYVEKVGFNIGQLADSLAKDAISNQFSSFHFLYEEKPQSYVNRIHL